MNLNCYIVDDEAFAVGILKDLVSRTPGLELLGTNTDPLTALRELSGPIRPDIVFLDIDMPELSGLALAGLLGNGTAIVFTTSHLKFAAEAFEKEAVDYLLKPIPYERFLQAIQKVRKLRPPALSPGTLFVKTGIKGQHRGIAPGDIIYVAAALNFIELFLPGERVITYASIAELLERLPGGQFARIHKSYAVNTGYISILENNRLRTRDGTWLPIGRTYREAFHQKMNGMLLGR